MPPSEIADHIGRSVQTKDCRKHPMQRRLKSALEVIERRRLLYISLLKLILWGLMERTSVWYMVRLERLSNRTCGWGSYVCATGVDGLDI